MKALYVTDRAAVGDRRFFAVVEALAGAPIAVQLREKETGDRGVLDLARAVRERLGPAVPLWLHRRFDLALAAGAGGVHLPADGLPVPRIRAHTPRGFRIGVSTHAPEEAAAAIAEGADAVVIGPIFDTPSKREYGPPLGPDCLSRLPDPKTHHCEVFAIGGIREDTIAALEPYRGRIAGIAAIRLFQESDDPAATAARIAAR